MVRLALDTATPLGSVAVGEGGRLLVESVLPVRAAAHTETLLPEVDRCLAAVGRSAEEVEAVVVGSGPGSFTGVRIAAAVAKGFRLARDLPLYAYPSLTAVAAAAGLPGRLCAAFDARRDQVYAAVWTGPGDPAPARGPEAWELHALLDALDGLDGEAPWLWAGDGALHHRERLEAAGARVLPAGMAVPRGSALLWLAERWPERGRVEAPADWEPDYVRASSARRASAASP